MSRYGDGPTCAIVAAHGRTYLIDGRPWCADTSHDRTRGEAWRTARVDPTPRPDPRARSPKLGG